MYSPHILHLMLYSYVRSSKQGLGVDHIGGWHCLRRMDNLMDKSTVGNVDSSKHCLKKRTSWYASLQGVWGKLLFYKMLWKCPGNRQEFSPLSRLFWTTWREGCGIDSYCLNVHVFLVQWANTWAAVTECMFGYLQELLQMFIYLSKLNIS